MRAGIRRCGDAAECVAITESPRHDVGVIYGWFHREVLRAYPQFMYADLGYWRRDTHYRVAVGDWSPHRYIDQGMSSARLESFGVRVASWRSGEEILIAGASAKSAAQHGYRYMEWERRIVRQLEGRLMYRPKPKDPNRQPIPGTMLDTRPADVALDKAGFLVTHHSNMAIDALVAGIPVHCVTGAAAAFSVPIDAVAQRSGREQFLADVAWQQWSLAEMESGDCWSYLKERGIIQC